MLGRLGSRVARRHHVTPTMAAGARQLSSLPIPYTASKEGPFNTGDSATRTAADTVPQSLCISFAAAFC